MRPSILNTYAFNLVYAGKLLDGIADDQMATQLTADGHVVPNHPAWVIGHLANTSAGFGSTLLGVESIQVEGWQEILGGSSTPVADASIYPDKQTLADKLTEAHEYISDAFLKVDDARLAEPNFVERLAPVFPTIGDMITFVLTSHETTHLGQLSAWRRGMGLPSAF